MGNNTLIKSAKEFDETTKALNALHAAIDDELTADNREAAQRMAFAAHLVATERMKWLEENKGGEAVPMLTMEGGKPEEPEEVYCRTCGLTLDFDGITKTQCYNQTHDFMCDVFHRYADATDAPCDDADCDICCDCARCASGEVRHCPECGPNESEDAEEVNKDCPMCEGTGAVSL